MTLHRVAIIDDDQDFPVLLMRSIYIIYMRHNLTKPVFEVYNNPLDADKEMGTNAINAELAFIDTRMPKLMGYELCKHLKTRLNGSCCPIIGMSGNEPNSELQYEMLFREAGAVGFYSKNILLGINNQKHKISDDQNTVLEELILKYNSNNNWYTSAQH